MLLIRAVIAFRAFKCHQSQATDIFSISINCFRIENVDIKILDFMMTQILGRDTSEKTFSLCTKKNRYFCELCETRLNLN